MKRSKFWVLIRLHCVHSVKALQIVNFLMFNNKSSLVLKKLIVRVSTYGILDP